MCPSTYFLQAFRQIQVMKTSNLIYQEIISGVFASHCGHYGPAYEVYLELYKFLSKAAIRTQK